MDAEPRRTRRSRTPAQQGQVLVLFVLIFATCCLAAAVAVAVGQVVVRRHQAQMVVDAAAFAGAASQAKGMNTIAHLNQMAFTTLATIYWTSWEPFIDNSTTTDERLILGALTLLWNEWAGDTLTGYQDSFKSIDRAIDLTNLEFGNANIITGPPAKAEAVIKANFGSGSDKIFKQADYDSSGMANPLDYAKVKLVKLTDPTEYTQHIYTYVMNPDNVCTDLPFPADAICWAVLVGQYGDVNAAIDAYRIINPIKYKTGRFYDQSSGDDVRFAYKLTITATKPMFGRTFFSDLPPITVLAAAKPYNGYLGKKFNGMGFLGIIPPSQAKDIKETYQAKLVPLKTMEKMNITNFDFEMMMRTLH